MKKQPASITIALITAISSIIVTLITVGLPLWTQNRVLKSRVIELEEEQKSVARIAEGLAAGYYENYLKVIFGLLQNDKIKVKLSERDGKKYGETNEFAKGDIEFNCIVPHQLTSGRIEQCNDKLLEYDKGAIVRGGNNRDFSINYVIQERGGRKVLVIADVAKPLFACKTHLEMLMGRCESDKEWETLSVRAIHRFEEMLDRYRQSGSGSGINQFSYYEIR